MNFAAIFKAFDTVMVIREAAKRLKGEPPPPESGLATTAPSGLSGQIEARLTNVVVAALKEAFDRDHARMELERAQLDEQRRRAEEAMRAELRRQAADREVGRLRLLAGTALVGWIASVVMLVARVGSASTVSRMVVGAGWLMLLGALGAAFTAQGRVGASASDGTTLPDDGRAGAAALWLLLAGLALSAISLLV
jgi:hypothetical protein